MPLAPSCPPDRTDADGLAKTRVRFLTADTVEPAGVRQPILASWRRSRSLRVAADRIDLPYLHDPDLDTPLARSARPVLRRLAEQLDGQAISIVLTDAAGLVLSRLTGSRDLERHLDKVRLAPGFSYAEQFVGTNGIGTALEGGRAMHVFGHEHYAENLENLACAGIPIHHPVSGKTVGALDLTCWRKDAGPLLITLAKATTEQIRQALLTDTGVREVELLQEYLRACRRSSGIVFALNNEVSMMNEYARRLLDPADQAAVLRQAAEGLAGQRRSAFIDLPSGARGRMLTRPVGEEGVLAGVVINLKLIEAGPVETDGGGTASRMLLPGLVGSSAVWRRACDEVEAVYGSGEWLAVEGEPGVGKLAVLRAVHQRRNPAARFTVVDAAAAKGKAWLQDVRRGLSSGGDAVVIRHVDQLDGVRVRALSAALQAAREGDEPRAWVAATFSTSPVSEEFGRLLQLFPRSVVVPPLRHHVDDLERLVPFLLSRLGYGGKLACSPEVMQVLMRATWPGNVEQVLQTLRSVVQHRRTGTILPADLPPELLTVSRRLLSPLESLERDAIVRSLLDSRGNKARAATTLGMSRATIYRKIREFGIVAHDG